MEPLPPRPAWAGELWLGSDYCLIKGKTGTTRPHAHYAHQVLIAPEGQVHALIAGQAQCGQVLVIESGQEHAILAAHQPVITLFAEPLAFDLPTLHRCCVQTGADLELLAHTARNLPRRALDTRVARALERIRSVNDETLPADVLAREASISLSQLERLFRTELGLSVRRLVLWQRLRQALKSALGGSSLTTAAVAAGFSDSAHLSRMARSQFGIRADQTLRHFVLRILE